MKLWKPLLSACLAVAFAGSLVDAARADTPNPFSDVPTSSWAYHAIVRLHDLGYLKGYPNGYFDGSRPVTRYEMAVMVSRVVDEIEYDLFDPNGPVRVDEKSIADVKTLVDQYGGEIADLKQKEAALDTKVGALGATLDRMQIHLFYYLRAPGTYTETVSAFAPNGAPLPRSTAISDGSQSYVTGTNGRGTGLQVLRLIFSGNFDKQSSYVIRLENKNYFGQANVNGFDNVTPSAGAYDTQGVLRINYAYIRYQLTNSPVYFIGGKYGPAADLGLAFNNDYYNGGLVGFAGKSVNGFLGFGQTGGPDLGSTSPFGYVASGSASSGSVPHTQFTMAGHLGANVTSRMTLGINWVEEQAFPQKIWSTAKQNFLPFNSALAVGSLAANYQASPTFDVAIEGLRRLGDDPTTHAAWADNGAVWFQALIGHTAAATNNNYVELGYVGTGYNSVINQQSYLSGTPFYTYYYSGQDNDRKMVYFGAHHWLNNNVRVGLNYLDWGLNVPEPIVPNGTTIPNGSYMGQNDNRALFINTQVSF